MSEYILTLRKKIASLQGDSFDSKMNVDDYHRLINIQKVVKIWKYDSIIISLDIIILFPVLFPASSCNDRLVFSCYTNIPIYDHGH